MFTGKRVRTSVPPLPEGRWRVVVAVSLFKVGGQMKGFLQFLVICCVVVRCVDGTVCGLYCTSREMVGLHVEWNGGGGSLRMSEVETKL